MNKIFNNKFAYDAGRLRSIIKIYNTVSTDDSYGGSNVVENLYLTARAGIKINSSFNPQVMQASQSGFEYDKTFIIRNRKNLNITADMTIEYNKERYEIIGFLQQDNPITFIGILCSKLKD